MVEKPNGGKDDSLLTGPLEQTPIYREIAERLRRHIVDQDLRPGDKIPTEQELMALFNVSRSSVREALRLLQASGVIETRRRHGAVVAEPKLSDLMSQLAYGIRLAQDSHASLWEARLVIEMGALPVVISRVNSDNLSDLQEILHRMEEAMFSATTYAQLDLMFHRRILAVTQNEVIIEFTHVIEEFFAHPRNQIQTTPAQRKLSTQEHQQLLESIMRGQLSTAQTVLHRHLWRYNSAWGTAPQIVPSPHAHDSH